jgi:hypothetical protein
MSDIAPQHKYHWPDAHEAATTNPTRTKQGMQIMKKIAKSMTNFFTVVITGIIEGRTAQAEYIAKHHHWY